MEASYQESFTIISESLQYIQFFPLILNMLVLVFVWISKDLTENAKVVRIVLTCQFAFSVLVYCKWYMMLCYILYIILLTVNIEALFDLSFSFEIPYFKYSSDTASLIFQMFLNFLFLAPDSNHVSVPYLIPVSALLFTTRFLVIIQKTTDESSVYFHFVALKYLPVFYTLINSFLVCYNDWKIYPDHVVGLGLVCFAIRDYHNFVYVKEPEKIKNPVIFNQKEKIFKQKKNVFEIRPTCDGGEQGKSPLPYYMDDDGDIANEFYDEVNKKFVKVTIDKLKLV